MPSVGDMDIFWNYKQMRQDWSWGYNYDCVSVEYNDYLAETVATEGKPIDPELTFSSWKLENWGD